MKRLFDLVCAFLLLIALSVPILLIALLVTPGLTGWAQINGRDELPIPVKVAFDEHYLKHRSFQFDLKILFLTFFKVLRREGVTH